MFTKIIIAACILLISQNHALANTCPDNSVRAYDMLQSWSKSLNKKVEIDVPSNYNYCVKFENEIAPKNDMQLEAAMRSLNSLFNKFDLLPLQIYSFPDTILITTLVNTVKE